MRHELLYTAEHGYTSELASAPLHDGAMLQGYGRGSGTVQWEDRSGTIEWVNFPQRRPDGVFMPDVRGVIRLDRIDQPILYRMEGISLLPQDGRRLFSGPVRWYTAAPDYAWLGDRYGFEEGTIELETGRVTSCTYVLQPDAPS